MKIFLNIRTVLFIAFVFGSTLLCHANNPKYEIRGVWLTTNYGLDWSKGKATTPTETEKQKASLCEILDLVKAMNMNTVFFQARVRSDVLYESEYEPYNAVMTGTRGKKPLYDPLAFAIEECHKRGLQCHAWVVCMNVGSSKAISMQGKNSLPAKRPDICTLYNGEWYLNPGEPETKSYLIKIVNEIIRKYGVDGIHLDYIRYPDRGHDFPDQKSFKRYAKQGETLKEWRINNINNIVYGIYDEVKAYNPKIIVSSAVLGKRDNLKTYSSMGWSGMEAAYQDVAAWLKKGKQDFVAPMLYYADCSFFPFVKDWVKNSNGYPVVMGLGAYRLLKTDGNWSLRDFMPQIYESRAFGAMGHSFYRMKQLEDNVKGISFLLASEAYNTPALFPALKNGIKEDISPYNLNIEYKRNGTKHLAWQCFGKAKYYTLYASPTYPVDTQSAKNILKAHINENQYTDTNNNLYYAVTATDGYYNESEAVQLCIPVLHFKEGESIEIPDDEQTKLSSITITAPSGEFIFYTDSEDEVIEADFTKGIYYMHLVYDNKKAIYPLIIN